MINSNKKVDLLHDQIKETNSVVEQKNMIIANLKESLRVNIVELKKTTTKHMNELNLLTEENHSLKSEITDFR